MKKKLSRRAFWAGITMIMLGTFVVQEVFSSEHKIEFGVVSSGSEGPGDVRIELQPLFFKDGKLVVEFGMNTHSVNLGDFDLKEMARLEYGEKSLRPFKSDRLRGHHPYGLIIFDLGEEIRSFRIIIRGIPREAERVFEWNI